MEQNEGKEEEQEGEKRVISEKRGRKETFLKNAERQENTIRGRE